MRSVSVGTLLRAATAWLDGQGVDEARLSVELLLAHALETNRAGVFARLRDPIAPDQRQAFEEAIARRMAGEPVAYILGSREFYGHTFRVGPGVLVPRPESELLVEQTIAFVRGCARPAIVDVGTGSGAIAVALALRLPSARIAAIDLSTDALAVAQANVQAHDVADRVRLIQADLVAGLRGRWDVVVANLPYVPSAAIESLDRSVRDWEPRLALDGGSDGLDPHRRLLAQVDGLLAGRAMVILEIADDRGELALAAMRAALPRANVALLPDAFGRARAVRAILLATDRS